MREFMTIAEGAPPPPRRDNIRDAIEHADHEGHGWKQADFTLAYLGHLTVEEIEQYDDVGSWLEVDDEGDIDSFRSGSFAGRPSAGALPPVIVITAPDEGGCHTQIGDGRGRINYAHAMKIRLHVWHLIHRDCAGE